MIEASFDRMSGAAAIAGVYQYDTGQRMRLSGLPSPEEIADADDLISGDVATLTVHFAYEDDTQTQARLAEWNDDKGVWIVPVPNEYLTRYEAVHVYVYVSYGENASGSRNKTMYEGVYTPIRRPAPGDVVTEDQLENWGGSIEEIDLVLSNAQTAINKVLAVIEGIDDATDAALAAVNPTNTAAQNADSASSRLNTVESRFGALKVQTTNLSAGSGATASLNGSTLTLGVPKGVRGDTGPAGEDGPSDMTISFDSSTGTLTITTM